MHNACMGLTVRGSERHKFHLQISSQFLFAFQRLEKGFEVAFAKTTSALAFDDFKENGGAIADGAVIEVYQLCEAENTFVEGDPFVHFAQFDIPNDVVNGSKARWTSTTRYVCSDGTETGEKCAPVVLTLDEGVNGLAIGGNGG